MGKFSDIERSVFSRRSVVAIFYVEKQRSRLTKLCHVALGWGRVTLPHCVDHYFSDSIDQSIVVLLLSVPVKEFQIFNEVDQNLRRLCVVNAVSTPCLRKKGPCTLLLLNTPT